MKEVRSRAPRRILSGLMLERIVEGPALRTGKLNEMNEDLLNEAQKTDFLEQLSHILEDEFFRGGHRRCYFLEYSVRYLLDGRLLGELKMRTIVAEVFNRAVDCWRAVTSLPRKELW